MFSLFVLTREHFGIDKVAVLINSKVGERSIAY